VYIHLFVCVINLTNPKGRSKMAFSIDETLCPDISECYHLLCIDPGQTHLAAAIFKCLDEERIEHLWSYMYSPGKDPAKLGQSIHAMSNVAESFKVDQVLLEYQAPMGVIATNRWNTYTEGGLATGFNMLGWDVQTISVSAAKRDLGLATGNYNENKKMALMYAQKHCPTIKVHHVGDCYVLARYFMKRYAFKLV